MASLLLQKEIEMPTTPSVIEGPSQSPSSSIAPGWHTAVVILFLTGMAALTLHEGAVAMQPGHRAVGYLITMAIEWLIVGFIALGARWGGASVRVLAGSFAPTRRSILRDLGIALAYLLVAQVVLGSATALVHHFIRSTPNEVLKSLVPHTGIEDAVYLLLAVTAGICEETIFRGYLQRQFRAWTGNSTVAILLQGVLFGAAHAYQGASMMIVIAIYGCMFGWLTWWRKSLRPGMMAHFIQDAAGGLLLAKYALK